MSSHPEGLSGAPTSLGAAGGPAATARPGATVAPRPVMSGTRYSGPELLRRLGGWPGRHAARSGLWFAAAPWALGLATLTWLVLFARQLPCRQTDLGNRPNSFYRLCYSDISVLYQNRHLGQGANPFEMEYPVLTGTFVSIARSLAGLLGAPLGAGITPAQELQGANTFFAVNAVLLFCCFLVTVLMHVLANPRRPFDALMVAVAPVVAATGLINWDLFPVALTAVAVWAWSRRMPVTAGAFIGLGVAAKLYPFLLLVALFPLCLRASRVKEFAYATVAAVVAWAVPNASVYAVSPEAWRYFWTFNVDRGGDLGSLWYVLGLAGVQIGNVSGLTAALDVLGALAVVGLGLLAPRRPRFGQLAFLMVCWFLVVNKVYSPQYVLWLLPFVVLARPVWRDWLVWTAGELVYFAAIWGHLAGTTKVPGSNDDRVYWLAVMIRIAAELWLAAQVVRDVLRPEHDVVRADDGARDRDGALLPAVDDPQGGVLDDAPDAGWLAEVRDGILGRGARSLGEERSGVGPRSLDEERSGVGPRSLSEERSGDGPRSLSEERSDESKGTR